MTILISSLVLLQKFQVVLCQLRHEAFVRFSLRHILSEYLEGLTQLHTVLVDHVGQHKSGGATAAFHRLHKHFASLLQSLLNETVSCTEVLLYVLSLLILNLQVEILEVLGSQSVGFASHVEDVSDPCINQVLSLESCLVGTHKYTIVNFEQRDLLNRH